MSPVANRWIAQLSRPTARQNERGPVQDVQRACPESYRRVQPRCSVPDVKQPKEPYGWKSRLMERNAEAVETSCSDVRHSGDCGHDQEFYRRPAGSSRTYFKRRIGRPNTQMRGAIGCGQTSRSTRHPPHLNLVGLFFRLCQIVGRLQPKPCIGAAAERLVETDRHFR